MIRRLLVPLVLSVLVTITPVPRAHASPVDAAREGAANAISATAPDAAPAATRYDNTFMKDFVMDAPWRVIDAGTPIPITIILKDCDSNDVRELHWIRCWDVTGAATLLWDHDFDDEEIGDDPYEANFWTYITTVTEGHPSLPDGTPLSPANLGHGPGEAIELRVTVYYRDDWFNYEETRYLRVRVGHGGYPWPDGWYGGDTHYHTMYTNNIAEFGVPLPAAALAARALGLHWLTTTDHSCDLDEAGDGFYSYGTSHWEYTVQNETGIETFYRDNTAIGTTWDALGAEVELLDSPALRLCRGVELNVASVDPATYGKTLHCLVHGSGYIDSPLSGAIGERPVYPSLPDGMAQIGGQGCAYAAHPASDMNSEWGGLDWTVNGTYWSDPNIGAALEHEPFRGLQAFNTRPTRYSSNQANPWADFDTGVLPDDPYPGELLVGIDMWDAWLRESLTPLRKVFLAGGSDAHGDLNYATYIGIDNFATDNAIGKVQTVVRVPGSYAPGNLPPMQDILAALRAGRSVVTDGPFVEIGVDRNADGDFDDPGDLEIGDDGAAASLEHTPMTVRWATTADFGPVVAVELLASDEEEATTILSLVPGSGGEGWAGEAIVDLGPLALEGPFYFRAECRTDRGDDAFRAYTNPIWIDFEPASFADELGASGLALAVGGNPAGETTRITFALPQGGDATLAVYDVGGRLVRELASGAMDAGEHAVIWDGAGRGGKTAAGVYFVRLTQGGHSVVRKAVRVR